MNTRRPSFSSSSHFWLQRLINNPFDDFFGWPLFIYIGSSELSSDSWVVSSILYFSCNLHAFARRHRLTSRFASQMKATLAFTVKFPLAGGFGFWGLERRRCLCPVLFFWVIHSVGFRLTLKNRRSVGTRHLCFQYGASRTAPIALSKTHSSPYTGPNPP